MKDIYTPGMLVHIELEIPEDDSNGSYFDTDIGAIEQRKRRYTPLAVELHVDNLAQGCGAYWIGFYRTEKKEARPFSFGDHDNLLFGFSCTKGTIDDIGKAMRMVEPYPAPSPREAR